MDAKKITLIALVVVALAVVFLLPAFVSEPLIKAPQEAAEIDASPREVSPSKAAEKKQFREKAQQTLADVFAAREALEALHVRTWNEQAFQAALDLIQEGDELYSRVEYEQSLNHYRRALTELQSLQAESEQLLASSLKEGLQAMENGQLAAAQQRVELLNKLAPDNKDVLEVNSRLATLPEVIELLERGRRLRAEGELSAAEQALARAAQLDPQHQAAAALLEQVKARAKQDRFNGQMGSGYAALERGAFGEAERHFANARQIDPDNAAARDALGQLENRRARTEVDRQLARARALEEAEEWQSAVDIYQNLIQLDNSLSEPKARLVPARVRAELDKRLLALIARPLALSNQTTAVNARQALDDALGIGSPGSKLSAQIEKLAVLLEKSRLPVDVRFESDNATEVTLYRVGKLGAFATRVVQLKPGKYIVAGVRNGYRDVRVEFTVTGDPLPSPIVVRCTETI